jgi:hypothetical protein
MKKIVINKTLRPLHLGAYGDAPAVTLIPGANEVHLDSFKKHEKTFKDMKEEIELPSESGIVDDLDSTTMGAYDAKGAVDIVNKTFDKDTLVKYQIEEMSGKKRATVLKAIESQIKLNEDAVKKASE